MLIRIFFKVFTLPIINGNQKTPLDKPNTVVISEKLASNIFGNADPVGKTITVTNRDEDYTISAVMKDIPENSHFHFDILASTLGYANAKKNYLDAI